MNLYCDQCGSTIDATSRFCPVCGAKQETPATAEQFGTSQSQAGASPGPTSSSPVGASAQIDTSSWPLIAGSPIELWAVIGLFALPGGWIVIWVLKSLPTAIKYMGADYFGFRLGLALTLILTMVGLIGAAMVVIALRLYRRDPVGRGLAYACAGALVIDVAFAKDANKSEIWAMILSLVAIAILALTSRVGQIFDQAASKTGEPTSLVISRTLIAIFSAFAVFASVIYFLVTDVSGKYAVAAVIALGSAIGAGSLSSRLKQADRNARLYLSIGAAIGAVLLLAFGRSAAGLLILVGLIVGVVAFLWLPSDAREFFGDNPLRFNA